MKTEEHFAMGALAAMRTPWHRTVPLDPDGSDPYWHDRQVLVDLFALAMAKAREAVRDAVDEMWRAAVALKRGIDPHERREDWLELPAHEWTAFADRMNAARGEAPR